MKFFLCLFFIAVFFIAGFEVYNLFTQRESLDAEILKFETQASVLESENGRLMKDIQYFGHDENLLKAFKEKFNYRKPEETLIILVPSQEAPAPISP